MKKGWSSKVAGSMLEREILKVVEFWYPKANPRRGGHRWLVLSIQEWQYKINMKAGDSSIRRALKSLREQGILIAERHRHPYVHNGGPVLWVRPDEEAIYRIRTEYVPNTDRIRTETYIQTTDTHKTEGQAHSGGPEGTPIDFISEADVMTKAAEFLAKKKAGASAAAGAAAFAKQEYSPDQFLVVKTPMRAHECLRAACLQAGYPAPGSFNKMRGGQMKTMLQRFHDEGVERPEVAEVLFLVAAKWPEFIGWTKSKFNVNVQGTAPNHASLTMYAVEAVGFWRSYAQTAGTVKEQEVDGGSSLDQEF